MVTVKEVAAACGVSRPAASLILNNRGERYRPETRQRVLEVARQMGYMPNATARALAKGQIASVGLLISTAAQRSAVMNSVSGIQRALRERNLHLTLAELPDAKLTDEGFVPQILREYSVGGFLIGYTHDLPARMVELIERHHIPSVWLNSKRSADCVYFDDLAAGRDAAEHLIGLGHRRVGYLSYGASSHYSHADRFAGYAHAVREAGLAVMDYRAPDNLSGESVARHTRRFLDAPGGPPTALVCYTDWDAMMAIMAVQQMGLRCPGDLSLIGVNAEPSQAGPLALGTMLLPVNELGAAAVAMLMQKLTEPDRPLPPVVLRPTLLPGTTSVPPPALAAQSRR